MTIDDRAAARALHRWLLQTPTRRRRTPAEVAADRVRIQADARATLDRLEKASPVRRAHAGDLACG